MHPPATSNSLSPLPGTIARYPVLPKLRAAPRSSKNQEATILHRSALTGLLLFVLIVGVEHLLNPSLNPLEHQVSEYVHTDSGALMVIGFAAWAISLAATGLLSGRFGEHLPAALFALAALGMTLVALFPTQTSAGELPPGRTLTLTGHLHDLGSGLTTVALLGTAVWSFAAGNRKRSVQLASAILILSALAISVALLIVGPSVGGLRQRLLLLIGCVWQFVFLRSISLEGESRA